MKRIIFLLVLLLVTVQGNAFAASIGGHLGLTVRGGIMFPSNQKWGTGSLETDSGYSFGGGVIYGVNNNIAAEVEVYHSSFKADLNGVQTEKFSTHDISIGGHYRFIGTAPMMQKAVPYIGGGIDVILADTKAINGGASGDINPAMGGHVKAGCDLFLNSNLALNIELRGQLSNESNIRRAGTTVGKYDGSAVHSLFGLRLFF